MTRRSLIRGLVGVFAGTVLARMPLAGAWLEEPLPAEAMMTPEQYFELMLVGFKECEREIRRSGGMDPELPDGIKYWLRFDDADEA